MRDGKNNQEQKALLYYYRLSLLFRVLLAAAVDVSDGALRRPAFEMDSNYVRRVSHVAALNRTTSRSGRDSDS